MFRELSLIESDVAIEPTTIPYIFCNEQKQQQMLEILANRNFSQNSDAQDDRLHLGFSVWFNLDIICTTKPSYAVILDIDPAVYNCIYPLLKATLSCSDSKESFVQQFIQKIKNSAQLNLLSGYVRKECENLMTSVYGFLAHEEHFNWLKKMVADGRIFFGKADLSNYADIAAIENWMKGKKLRLETFYLSNIPEWISAGDIISWRKIKENLTDLVDSSTLLIDAFYPTQDKTGSGPPLRITEGKFPEYRVKTAKKSSSAFFTNSPKLPSIQQRLNFDKMGNNYAP